MATWVILTKPQQEMLALVRKYEGYRPRFYAEKMWGGKKAHQNARNAAVLLWRLERMSLVRESGGYWSARPWIERPDLPKGAECPSR